MIKEINAGGFEKVQKASKEESKKVQPMALPDRKIDTDSEDDEDSD